MTKIAARCLLTLLLMLAGLSLTVSAQSFSVIVETTPNADIRTIVATLGGKVLDSMDGNVYLVSIPTMPKMYPPGVKFMEADSVQLSPARSAAVFTVSPTKPANFYRNQPAMQRINLSSSSQQATGRGIVVADINALVDVRHPALIGHLTTGAQFLNGSCSNRSSLNQAEATFLDQAEATFLDQAEATFLDQAEATFLDQAEATFLDQAEATFLDAINPAHGHGTMVAGIVAVIAPDAMIMPLRAFDDKGCGTTFNIAKAIKHAVSHGAQVINLSFGISGDSHMLKKTIDEAVKAGITVVASAGNGNTAVPQYPAGYPGVLGVAATTLTDAKASFSNYGTTVSVSAPGVNIISAYPGGYYAKLSGTSFSAPMVAAEAALVRSLKTSGWKNSIATGVDNINAVNPAYVGQLGTGRINLLKALQ